MGGGQRVDGVPGDELESVGGVGEDAYAAGFDRQRLGADQEVDRGGAELGEPADLVHAGFGVVPAAVGDDPDGARAAAVLLASPRRLLERCREVDLLVELLQLAGARLLARAFERVLQQAYVGAVVGVALRRS